jgi:hypothetical protein
MSFQSWGTFCSLYIPVSNREIWLESLTQVRSKSQPPLGQPRARWIQYTSLLLEKDLISSTPLLKSGHFKRANHKRRGMLRDKWKLAYGLTKGVTGDGIIIGDSYDGIWSIGSKSTSLGHTVTLVLRSQALYRCLQFRIYYDAITTHLWP